jgi:hypothetical protein
VITEVLFWAGFALLFVGGFLMIQKFILLAKMFRGRVDWFAYMGAGVLGFLGMFPLIMAGMTRDFSFWQLCVVLGMSSGVAFSVGKVYFIVKLNRVRRWKQTS